MNKDQDESDLKMLAKSEDTIYATERNKCKSTVFVNIVNKFGGEQGYEKILATIKHEATSIDLVYYLVVAIGNCVENYHKSFIDKYCDRLRDAIQSKILNADEKQLRLMRRERTEEIVNTLWEKLMARLMTYYDTQVQKQIFNMNIGVLYLRQKFLERRIDGAKLIDHVCKQALLNMGTTQAVDLKEQLVGELVNKEVLDEFFSKTRCHAQLVQRSEGLLKLMISQKALQQDQLEMIWESCHSDEGVLIDLYKVLAEVAGVSTPELQFFVDKILQQQIGTVRVQEIELLESVCKRIQSKMKGDTTGVVSSILEFFWDNLFNPSHQLSDNVVNRVSQAFSEVLKGVIDKDIVYSYIAKMADNLHNSNHGFTTLKVLNKYLEDYVIRSGELVNPLPEKKQQFVEFIETQYHIIQSVFNDLSQYMQMIHSKFLEPMTEEQIDAINEKETFGKKDPHTDHVKLRLTLIGNMIEESTSILKLQHLETLWDVLITKNKITLDHQFAYKFMRNVCDAVLKAQVALINESDLISFVAQKTSSTESNFVTLSMEGYHFFQTFFILMNKRDHKLILLGDEGQNSQKMTSYNNQTGPTYKAYKFNQQNDSSIGEASSVEIMVKSSPNEMNGIKALWKIAIDCRDTKVGESVTSLLLQLHTNLDFGMEQQIPVFEDQFVSSCLQIIKEQRASISSRKPEEQAEINKRLTEIKGYYIKTQTLKMLPVEEKRIMRCLTYIQMLIKNSEKDGTRELRPHSALGQGEWLKEITVNNSYRTGNGYRAKITMQCYSNVTLYEFKGMIAFQLAQRTQTDGTIVLEKPPHPHNITLNRYSSSSTLKDNDNGSTLAELKFRSSETITVASKSQYSASKVPLLNDDGTDINERAVFIFDQMFHTYCVEDKDRPGFKYMGIDEVCEFIRAATLETCDRSDKRATDILYGYDKNNDNMLERDDFIEFYRQACFAKIQTVRANLFKYNYNQQLRLMPKDGQDDNILQPRQSINEMPRHKIAKDDACFDTLFSLLDLHKEVVSEATSLVNMLCTRPAMLWDLMWLDNKPPDYETVDWRKILQDSNLNKIHYSLSILESFITSNMAFQDPKSYDYQFRLTWPTRFLEQGGIVLLTNLLTRVIQVLDVKDETMMSLLDQLLKIIQIFINGAIQADMSDQERAEKLQIRLKPLEESKEQIKIPFVSQDAQNNIASYSDDIIGPQLPPNIISNDTKPSQITEETLFGQNKDQQAPAQPTEEINPEFEFSERFTKIVNEIRSRNFQLCIYSALDFSKLQVLLLSIVSKINLQQSKKEENSIMVNSLELWQAMLQKDPTLIDEFYNWKEGTTDAYEFVRAGIYSFKAEVVRQAFKRTFDAIAEKITTNKGERPLFWLLNLLLKSFPTDITVDNRDKPDKTSRSNEFFGLFTKLIQQINNIGAGEGDFDLKNLLVTSITRMKSHMTTEKGSVLDDDRTLVGYLNLVNELMSLYIPLVPYEELIAFEKEHNLVHEIFYENLYYVPGKTTSELQNKCRGKNSRTSAYRLLLKILKAMKPQELTMFLSEDLWPMIQDLPKPDKWLHQPSNKSRYMYSGIVNLGCICYMISMLQQCFMVPQFRYLVLKAVDTKDVVMGEWKGRQIHDNLLVQFQRMFGFLEMTDRNAFDPIDFIYSFKQDGQPTNVALQCDCQEFLATFLDRIENLFAPTSQKFLVQDFFSFNNVSQMICNGCGNTKNLVESFYNLQCEVKNQTTLYDSLNKLIAPQEIQDYKCESCNKIVDLTKRTIVASTPNVLFVHLQRIVFSFDTFANEKINSKLEFPQILNLKPYTIKGIAEKEGTQEAFRSDPELAPFLDIDDDEFIYKLVGVTIHQGTADHGHYYSIINTARGKDEHDPYEKEADWLSVEKDFWKEFNDDEVKFFSFKDLEKEAFGSEVNSFVQKEQGSGKSAYMLVYERKKKKEIRQIENDQETKVNIKSIEKFVPDWLSKQVNKNNVDFVIDRQVFDDNFFTMVKQILEHISTNHVINQHKYGADYYHWFDKLKELALTIGQRVTFDFLARFNEKKQLQPITEALCNIMVFTESHVTYTTTTKPTTLLLDFIRKYYLADGCKNFFELMFLCSDIGVRMQIGKLTAKVINRAFIIWGICSQGDQRDSPRLADLYNTLHEFMQMIMHKLLDSECHKNWSRLAHYFTLLLDIAQGGRYQTLYMLENYNFVVDICDIMLGDKSPKAVAEKEKRVSMGGSVSTTPFGPLVALMSHLVRSMSTEQMIRVPGGIQLQTHTVFANEDKAKSQDDKKPLQTQVLISDEVISYITNPDLFSQVMSNGYQEEAFGKALAHLCFDNTKLSKVICLRLLKLIVFSDYDKVKQCIEVVNTLLTIKDHQEPSLQRKRLEWILGFSFLKWTQKQQDFRIQVGLETAYHNIKEEVYMMKSMLTYDPVNDNSLLHLLWRYQGRMDQYTVNCLDDLTRVMAQDEGIRSYLAEQAGPTYQYARFTDWIRPYLEAHIRQANGTETSSYHSAIKETSTRVLKQFETYEQSLREIDGVVESQEPQIEESPQKVIACKPEPYVILRQGPNENYLQDIIDKDELFLSISYQDCDYVWSKPTGKGNMAIGDKYLNKYTPAAYGAYPEPQSAAAMLQNREHQIQGTTRQKQDEAAQDDPQSATIDTTGSGKDLDDSFENWDGNEIYNCADLIYKFTLNNNTGTPIYFKIKLSERDNMPVNLNWPRTGIKGQIDVGETQVVCVLAKIRPDLAAFSDGVLEVEKLKIELGWKLNEQKMKQIANESTLKKSEKIGGSKVGTAVRFDEQVNTVTTSTETEVQTTQAGSGATNVQGDYFGEYFNGGENQFEKQCGTCTVINPVDATVCYLCQTNFV